MVDELQLVFGHNLREHRLARGLTRRLLGETMGGYGEAYIGAIERGDRNLTFETAVRLSRLAGADPFELLVRPPDWAERRAAASRTYADRLARRAAKKRRQKPPAPKAG